MGPKGACAADRILRRIVRQSWPEPVGGAQAGQVRTCFLVLGALQPSVPQVSRFRSTRILPGPCLATPLEPWKHNSEAGANTSATRGAVCPCREPSHAFHWGHTPSFAAPLHDLRRRGHRPGRRGFRRGWPRRQRACSVRRLVSWKVGSLPDCGPREMMGAARSSTLRKAQIFVGTSEQ